MTINPDKNEPEIPMSKEQAGAEIGAIFQYMATMGAISNESGDIQNILKQLNDGSIKPEDAVEMARKIEENRQENYH